MYDYEVFREPPKNSLCLSYVSKNMLFWHILDRLKSLDFFLQMAECDKKRFDVEMATYATPQPGNNKITGILFC